MLNYDPTAPPAGELEWLRLLTAIEQADPNDENEWLEFKAGLDLTTKAGRQALVRAIVAFANRDPGLAGQWLGGYAVIVIGLEPGNVAGCKPIDPADLYQGIQPYLVDPAPHWDVNNLTYNGSTVIAVTVSPPAAGDPIHVIGKNGDGVSDGDVLVRVKGSSRPARSADIRRLTSRAARVQPGLDITIVGEVAGGINTLEWLPGWVDDWLDAERARLLKPFAPPPPPKPTNPNTDGFSTADARAATLEALGLTAASLNTADILGVGTLEALHNARATSMATFMKANHALDDVLNVRHEEDRTVEAFREQVDDYLGTCRDQLPQIVAVLHAQFARPTILKVTNNTETNFTKLKVHAHVEGDIFGFEHEIEFSHAGKHMRRPPREFGPWSEPRHNPANFGRTVQSYMPPAAVSPAAPKPQITNGGSCDLKYPTFDLRPHETISLDRVLLTARGPDTRQIRFTWSATATNVDGVAQGTGTFMRAQKPTDLSAYLAHGYRRPNSRR